MRSFGQIRAKPNPNDLAILVGPIENITMLIHNNKSIEPTPRQRAKEITEQIQKIFESAERVQKTKNIRKNTMYTPNERKIVKTNFEKIMSLYKELLKINGTLYNANNAINDAENNNNNNASSVKSNSSNNSTITYNNAASIRSNSSMGGRRKTRKNRKGRKTHRRSRK